MISMRMNHVLIESITADMNESIYWKIVYPLANESPTASYSKNIPPE